MWKRNLITRSVAIVPSLVVAIVAGDDGADELIIWSQILLSIQLPFALIPLLKMTGSDKIMGDKYSNGKKLQITGWCIGLLIVIANVILVGVSVTSFINLNSWFGWVLLIIEAIIGILYVITIIYVSYVPVDQINYHITERESLNSNEFNVFRTEYGTNSDNVNDSKYSVI